MSEAQILGFGLFAAIMVLLALAMWPRRPRRPGSGDGADTSSGGASSDHHFDGAAGDSGGGDGGGGGGD